MAELPLQRLLDHWRAARHPSTSELIHRLADRLKVEVPRLPARKTDAARAWLAGVKGEPPALLSARLRQLEPFIKSTTPSLVWPLFEALSKQPADPRIATLATRLLVNDTGLRLTAKLTRRLLDCVETHGDDAHFRSLELGLPVATLGDGLAARALRLMQRGLSERPTGPELPLAERDALARSTFEAPALSTAAPLFAPVWAAPGDDAPRQVLADLLLERGDPRGEFISLQLAQASPRRQRQLLKAHGREWLGALRDVVELREEPPRFEKGFVAEVSVRAVKRAPYLLAADAPEWATVRRVRRGLQRFTPAMRALEDAGEVSLEALQALAREALPLALRSLTVAAFPHEAVEHLARLAAPPRWLGLHLRLWEPTRTLRDALPSFQQLPLERLRLSAQSGTVLPSLLSQVGLDWLPPGVDQLELRDGVRLIIFRRERRAWSLGLVDLHPRSPDAERWKDLLSPFGWFAPSGVSLSVRGEPEESQVMRLEQLARRFRLPVTAQHLEDLPPELAW